jgi:DNA invertase Pin-like site-specific DNA recombinase
MSQTIAYLRTSTDKQDLDNQKLEILEWARKKDLKIDELYHLNNSGKASGRGQSPQRKGPLPSDQLSRNEQGEKGQEAQIS